MAAAASQGAEGVLRPFFGGGGHFEGHEMCFHIYYYNRIFRMIKLDI